MHEIGYARSSNGYGQVYGRQRTCSQRALFRGNFLKNFFYVLKIKIKFEYGLKLF